VAARPGLAAEAAAYRRGLATGEAFSLAVRHRLFDLGQDPSDPQVLEVLLAEHGTAAPSPADAETVRADHAEGVSRGVQGSPHFFVGDADFFCPSLDIGHDRDGYHMAFDAVGFDRFVAAAFG
jgi:2-hydroxychromene-2-carboxylate isomerase